MTDFRVEMMNEDYTRVYPEIIRVSLTLVGQLSYEWMWGIIYVLKEYPAITLG